MCILLHHIEYLQLTICTSVDGYNDAITIFTNMHVVDLHNLLYIVTSFLEFAKDVKFLLTEHFTQDPIESFFGDQRSRGRWNTNPTVQQYSINTNILRVSSGLSRIERGNTRGKERDTTAISTTTLRKRNQLRN